MVKYDIAKLITISSGHISEKTAKLLNDEPTKHNMDLAVYPKAQFGWFIYIGALDTNAYDHLPEDLKACALFTREHDCEWLCLDSDGEEMKELPMYQ